MTTSIIDDFIANGFSPATQLNAVYRRLDEALAGKIDIVDTTSPFACGLDMAACLSSAAIVRQEAALRRPYKVLSRTYDDLYHHMSDVEYLGRFSNYSTAKFFMYLRLDEIKVKAVKKDGSEIRKIIMPKHTQIKVDGTPFTLLYPIEIRIMPHGGLQVVYDTEVMSPIGELQTNFIEWKIVQLEKQDFLMLYFDLPQLLRRVYTDTLNPSTTFKKKYSYQDRFYYCRVFGVAADGTKQEFATTHSEVVHDINVPTAVLKVTEDSVTVEIPRIYFSRGLLPTQIEIVVYTTKGELNLNFGSGYALNQFSMVLGSDYTSAGDSKYSAPLSTWANMGIGSSDVTRGGTNGKTVEQLRQDNIDGSTKTQLPITEAQLRGKLRINGYDLIKSVDDLMDRIYLATRHLPAVEGSGFTTGVSTSMETLLTSMEDLAGLDTVIDNGDRLTLQPETIYRHDENGLLEVVPSSILPVLGDPDAYVSDVNRNRYMYSPLHYVLDAVGDRFEVRPYYLGAPRIATRRFVEENDTSQLGISSSKFTLDKTDTGYVLTVISAGEKTYLEQDPDTIFAQLSFVPKKETGRAFINGALSGLTPEGNYVWEFPLNTRFDIDSDDQLILENFTMFANQFKNYGCDLEQEFELIYGIHNYDVYGLQYSGIDEKLGRHLLTDSPLGLTNEAVTLNFGAALQNLWAKSRTVMGSERYQLHEYDIPKVWGETEFVLDVGGSPAVTLVDGVVQYEVLHRAGDPVLGQDGLPEYLHRAGDVVRDADGLPILLYDRKTERSIDLFLMDGNYAFANHARDVAYRKTIASTIVSYASGDMEKFKPTLHEKTSLFFYPKKTLGKIKVIIDDGKVTEIPAALEFTVRFYMDKLKYKDLALRAAIAEKTKTVINNALQRSTVSRDYIQNELSKVVGDDVLFADMDNFGEDKNFPAFTAVDDSTRCAVKRRLKVLSDNSIMVEEAITVDFVPHIG